MGFLASVIDGSTGKRSIATSSKGGECTPRPGRASYAHYDIVQPLASTSLLSSALVLDAGDGSDMSSGASSSSSSAADDDDDDDDDNDEVYARNVEEDGGDVSSATSEGEDYLNNAYVDRMVDSDDDGGNLVEARAQAERDALAKEAARALLSHLLLGDGEDLSCYQQTVSPLLTPRSVLGIKPGKLLLNVSELSFRRSKVQDPDLIVTCTDLMWFLCHSAYRRHNLWRRLPTRRWYRCSCLKRAEPAWGTPFQRSVEVLTSMLSS